MAIEVRKLDNVQNYKGVCLGYTGSGTVTVVTPASGKRLAVGMITAVVDAAAAITSFLGTDVAANQIVNGDYDINSGVDRALAGFVLVGDVDAALKVTASAGNVKGVAAYWEI